MIISKSMEAINVLVIGDILRVNLINQIFLLLRNISKFMLLYLIDILDNFVKPNAD